MAIIWTKVLSTGLLWQDAQHIELFKRVSALIDAVIKGQGTDEVEKMFAFLDEYFVYHFDAEEQAMHGADFPDAKKHLLEHYNFINDVARLRAESKSGLSADEFNKKVERVMVDWLVNHIGGMDKDLGVFLVKYEQNK